LYSDDAFTAQDGASIVGEFEESTKTFMTSFIEPNMFEHTDPGGSANRVTETASGAAARISIKKNSKVYLA
jgi:hypothetical protein